MPQNPIGVTPAMKSGVQKQLSVDAQGNEAVTQGHGKYYLASYGQRVFGGANQTGATLSAGLATTYVGLCLSNPVGSGVNLIIQRVTAAIIVAPTLLALGLIAGWSAAGVVTHTTALAPAPLNVGSAVTPAGLLDAACTIVGTPAWVKWLANTQVSADLPSFVFDADGALIIQPGGYVAIGGNVAGPTAGLLGSFEWEEAPL